MLTCRHARIAKVTVDVRWVATSSCHQGLHACSAVCGARSCNACPCGWGVGLAQRTACSGTVQGDAIVAEMLTKLFKRKAERDGTPGSPDLLASFLHEVRGRLRFGATAQGEPRQAAV